MKHKNIERVKEMEKMMIAIEWIDASLTQEGETYSFEDACKEELIHGFAVGVLVKEFKDRYVIARDWFDEHDTYRGLASYPKSGIVKIFKYKIANKNE